METSTRKSIKNYRIVIFKRQNRLSTNTKETKQLRVEKYENNISDKQMIYQY